MDRISQKAVFGKDDMSELSISIAIVQTSLIWLSATPQMVPPHSFNISSLTTITTYNFTLLSEKCLSSSGLATLSLLRTFAIATYGFLQVEHVHCPGLLE